MVRVFAANEEMAKLLKHGVTKVGFTSLDQSVSWPDDSFTARRIRDGDVITEDAKAEKEKADQEKDGDKHKKHHRSTE